jgi:hypothetical protein
MEEYSMTVEKVEKYFEAINLNHYGLGGVEITEDDYQVIADKVNATGDSLKTVVDEYLYEIREILDEGLEDDLEDDLR